MGRPRLGTDGAPYFKAANISNNMLNSPPIKIKKSSKIQQMAEDKFFNDLAAKESLASGGTCGQKYEQDQLYEEYASQLLLSQ